MEAMAIFCNSCNIYFINYFDELFNGLWFNIIRILIFILSEQKKLGKQLVAELADIEEQISANNTIKEDLDSGIRA